MTLEPMSRRVLDWVVGRSLVSPGTRGILACSGGRDSLALLHILHCLRRPLQIDFTVVFIDHGLRDIAAEMSLVEQRVAELGLKLIIRRVQVEEGTGSLQAAAREERLAALETIAREQKAKWIATGHTSTDQAETVMFRMARGAGLRGLGGIRPKRGLWIRPLLCLSRQDTTEHLSKQNWKWADDPSNEDDRFARVEIRERWFPMMRSSFPGIESRIAANAMVLQDASDFLEQAVGQAFSNTIVHAATGVLECDVQQLRAVDRRLRALCLQRGLERVGCREVSGIHLQQVLSLIEDDAGTRELDLPGVRVTRTYDQLVMRVKVLEEVADDYGGNENFPDRMEEIPGQGCYAIGKTVLTVDLVENPASISHERDVVYFSHDTLQFPLGVRKMERGDRMRPFGLNGTKLISDVLIDRKVPKIKRSEMQVLTSGGVVIWLMGVLRSDEAPVESSCRKVWRFQIR